MFDCPAKAEVNRTLPKTKLYAHANPSRAGRDRFVSQVAEIVWKYKLSPDTVNLPARGGIEEIQIFSIVLKSADPVEDVLRVIDRAIPSPVFFELSIGGTVKFAAADKKALDIYFETAWQPVTTVREPLPVAVDLAGLYEQILRRLIPFAPRAAELIEDQIERARLIRAKQRECERIEARIRREEQFNRVVEINSELRRRKAELQQLLQL